jgi:hypothetical protein
MASVSSIILGRSKNPAFLDTIKIAISEVGKQMLLNNYGYNPPIAINAVGYNACYKRNYLAAKIISNPELYAENFARLLLINDENVMNETDFGTMTKLCSNQAIFDAVAGINLNDINF